MSQNTFHLHIQRLNATENMARYYRLAIEPTLFGTICLVRNWGRVGTRGQERIEFCEDENQALRLFLKILKRKRRRGYRPVPTTADYSSRLDIYRAEPMTKLPNAGAGLLINKWKTGDGHEHDCRTHCK